MVGHGQPFGHLSLSPGTPLSISALACIVRADEKETASALNELTSSGIWRSNGNGVLFDPDLVETEHKRRRSVEFGRMGGNPLLKNKAPVNRADKPPVGTAGNPAVNPPDNVQKRREEERRGESSTLAGSSEGQDPELEPHVPTLEEFVACFMADGIPREYLEDKWNWFEGNKAWLTSRNELKDFRVLVRGWWKKDRATWRAETARDLTVAATGIEVLEAALKTEKNPAEREKLRSQLKALEGKS